MSHPIIIQTRAFSSEEGQAMFETIFAKRLEFLAAKLEESDRPVMAELALKWAAEHRTMAATLRGERQIGDGEDDNPFANAEFAPQREDRKVRA